MNDSVLVEVGDGIATVTLNRPAALNALNDAMVDGLAAAMAQVEADAAVRCVLLRGAGDHFMAGGDLKFFHGLLERPPQGRHDHFQEMIGRLHPAIVAMRTMPKPVVVSLRGAAAGFGLSLALAADLAVAAEDAYFTLAYSLIGTSPDGGSSWHLPRLVGLRKAMEIALLGDRFDAAEALRLGLVNRVVPAAELEAESAKIVRRLAAGAGLALGRTKALLSRSFDRSLAEQLDAERDSFAACAASDDFAEGIAAFLEKRKAAFTGR